MAKSKKNNSNKLTFKEKLLQKSFEPLCNKLIYACYLVYCKDMKSSSISYDDFMLGVKDVLNGNFDNI